MIRTWQLNSFARYALAAATLPLMLVAALCSMPQSAFADEGDQDILLSMFTTATEGGTNNIFASYDGETHYLLASIYDAEEHEPYYDDHYPQACTGLIYHDGFFWALSGQNRNDGKFWPTISYSSDLVHWTHPEGDALMTGTHGIVVDDLPYVGNDKSIGAGQFDVVAPKWAVTANGEIYIVFSAGFFGVRYDEGGHDLMQAYTVHVTELSADEGEPDSDAPGGKYLWPKNLTFKADSIAQKLEFTDYDDANYIDAQLFTNDGIDYLLIKRDGATNQLLKTTDIDDPTAWTMVNEKVTWGYEAPTMVYFNNAYRLFVDGLEGRSLPGLGIRETISAVLTQAGRWDEPVKPMFLDENDEEAITRHGTSIVLEAGTDGWKAAKRLRDEQGRRESGVMHRLYNDYSGEHFYTSSGLEAGGLTTAGWTYEGIGWLAPADSSTPVYRLYNPYEPLGDHHYTTDEDERNRMVKAGWTDEDIGWYSDDKQGTPLYRQYNPNAYASGMSGAHNYTSEKAENDHLVKVGWKAEGIAWYGLAETVEETGAETSNDLQAAAI